jgi:hypothetical protein
MRILRNIDCDDGRCIDIQFQDNARDADDAYYGEGERDADDTYYTEGIAHAGGPLSGPEGTIYEGKGIGKLIFAKPDPKLAEPLNQYIHQMALQEAQNREANVHCALKGIRDCTHSIQIFLQELGESYVLTIAQKQGIEAACAAILDRLKSIHQASSPLTGSPGQAILDSLSITSSVADSTQGMVDRSHEHKDDQSH